MNDEETLHKLTEMRLHGMVAAVREIQALAPGHSLSFSEKLGMVVDREWTDRENRKLARFLRAAKLPTEATLEDAWCQPGRGLTKALVRDLATCKWIDHHHNVIVLGKTGCGKSFLATALAQAACRQGRRALYVRVPRLLHDLTIARAEGSYSELLRRFAQLDVLVLDDFLIAPLSDVERRDMLEVLEDRYDHTSTVIATQVPTKNWHSMLADPTIADAICDRLVHNAHVIPLTGRSMREQKGMSTKSTTT
ncbi:IS21-like element helper ATPase IstB [Paraliomyxa miuraensis]|uniref:IS21-like element helper ATPase IstB n=1 Tax=Paraliomyxa miuraensis TaxID=376150 RepID=UPI002255E167|nr:IS21-like element helper ATPase IstB [Paraliomyxa miuraensis]MCX4239943.1 IS21-like element helper ATPase IstB [Paraliomyxa miuraensis]